MFFYAFHQVGYGRFDRNHLIGPATWPHHDLFVVHQGTMALRFQAADRELKVDEREGVLIWPSTAFAGHVTSARALVSIHHFSVQPGVPTALSPLLAQRQGWTCLNPRDPRDLIRDVERSIACHRSLPVEPSPAAQLEREARLSAVLSGGGLLTPDAPREQHRLPLARLTTWVRDHLPHRPGVTQLAAAFDLSASRFRTVFLEEHGHPAGEFIRSVRDTEARRLLSETPEPVKAIAAALGFSDVVAFHHTFKSRTGQTPAAYRRQHRILG